MAKKIGAILSLIIIGVVIVAAIVMVNIKIDYSIDCVKPDKIWVQTSSDIKVANSEQQSKIVEIISSASKQNALTALFDGELGKKAELVNVKTTVSSPANFYVKYIYNTKQDLIVGGKEFKNADGQTETYEELIFVVDNTEGETQCKVYVVAESNSSTTTSAYYYKLDANFEELFKYLSENFN